MKDELEHRRFPGLKWHAVGGIEWNLYKHWGQGVWAGEGLEVVNGDRSGCIKFIGVERYTSPPVIVQARTYRSNSTGASLSAVYSYPMGIGLVDHYFWEIYPGRDGDNPERFDSEDEMEQAIKEILGIGSEE